MTEEIILHPIGKVVSERKDAVQDDWDRVAARGWNGTRRK